MPPLSAEELEKRLEACVYTVLTVRRSVEGPARDLAGREAEEQERFLASLEFIAGTSVELAYNFCAFALPALGTVPGDAWDEWVLHLMDIYDARGVLPCIVAMQKVDVYVEERLARRDTVSFQEVQGVLGHFVCGLNGRVLQLAEDERVFTDTEHLYLPPEHGVYPTAEENRRLYKAQAAHLWAQTWYGTWRGELLKTASGYPDPDRAVACFHALETLRLDACMARDLRGLAREMSRLGGPGGSSIPEGPWRRALERITSPGAGVAESYAWLPEVYATGVLPPPKVYQGVLLPSVTEEAIRQRTLREKGLLQDALARVVAERRVAGEPQADRVRFELSEPERDAAEATAPVDMRLNGEVIQLSQEVRQLLGSILQDFGEVPPEYLEAAGSGVYQPVALSGAYGGGAPAARQGACTYDEWDYQRRRYRKGWCLVYEKDVHPVRDGFVSRTRTKYRGLLRHLYRTFEALRGDDRRLRRQAFGDDVDLDAVVEAHVEQSLGREADERLFVRTHRQERNIAVLFMVDMSGSTKGWINDAQRESLVLLCEALETLGDRYAIYGFSGFTHKRCEVMRIKGFQDRYDGEAQARISGIRPLDYTRMGAAIRHLSEKLEQVEARTRLLITLSDGRPDDQDGYRGVYGIEDTRKALLEARYRGIHPFCITIDDEAMDYLPHMYGPVNFTVISDVGRLPYKVSDIYRKITM